MAKVSVTWLGEDPESKPMEWHGHTFEPGKAVEVESDIDAGLIASAKGNKYFKVSGEGVNWDPTKMSSGASAPASAPKHQAKDK